MTTVLLLLALLQDPPSGIVRGHAFSSSTGMTLKRVQVQLAIKGQKPFRAVVTARDGGYEFLRLAPGDYTVACSKAGYLSAAYGSKGPDQPPAAISVREREEASGKDCRLQHNGSINGTVSDEDGDPLTDVDVSALVRNYRHGQPNYVRAAGIRTDDHGHYRLYELPPGRYCLQAWRALRPGPKETEPALAPVFYPNSPRMTDCQTIDLRHGEEATHIDLILRETPTYALRGKVREARSGRFMAGALVSFFPEDYGGEARSAKVAPDGSYEFLNLIPARYRFDIVAPDDAGRQRHWTKVVELGDSDKEEALTPGAWPRVSVQLRIAGGNEIGSALPSGLRVSLVPRDVQGAADAAANSRGAGSFEFIDVLPGNYDLKIDAPPRLSFFVSELSSNGRDLRDSGIFVADMEKFLPVMATLDLQPAFISGRVLDEQGQPYAGAGLVAWSTDPQRRLVESYFKTTFTDASGNYRLSNLIPGEYYVAVWADYDPAQALEPEVLRRLEGSAIRVNALRQENVAGELRVTGEVRSVPGSFVR
jgi:protocatechuate 3,4-dioxygenase beta subunit